MPITSSGGMRRSSSGFSRYASLSSTFTGASMFLRRSMTLPIVAGSMPWTMTPARFDALDAITSPCTTGVAATTPWTPRAPRQRGARSRPTDAWLVVSTTMCALLPRIFRFRSALNPPITLMAPESENDARATAKMERPLMSVRNPLFFARTWRAATYAVKIRPLEPVERPRQERDDRADHEEQDARDDRAAAHDRVAQRPRRAPEHRQAQRPEREADEHDAELTQSRIAARRAAVALRRKSVVGAPHEERHGQRPPQAAPATTSGREGVFTARWRRCGARLGPRAAGRG